MKVRAALALLGVAACADVPPFEPYDHEAVLRAALAPNAHVLTIGIDLTSPDRKTTSHDLQSRVKLTPLDDGFVATVTISREEVVFDDPMKTVALVRATAGALHVKELAAARAATVRFGDEAVVVACGPEKNEAWLTSPEGFTLLSGSPPGCPLTAARGAAFGADEALVLVETSLSRWWIDRARATLTTDYDPEQTELPSSQVTLFLEETAPAEIATAHVVDGALEYRRGAIVHTARGVDGLDGPTQVARGPDRALRIATPAGLWRWDAETSSAAVRLDDVPAPPSDRPWIATDAPGGAYAWVATPNPLYEAELLPTAARVRYAEDDAFETFEPSATPCCDRDACRVAAESYVIGGFRAGDRRFAFYDLWTWVGANQHALVLAEHPLTCD
ncbi:hypothetical protein L6R52_35180 [Myxococcota bacterium]|nr:hypothetical protein [Myxococcota bacterium]